MVTLRYRDEHNKVGYLQKPTGSDDYHQILDFLRAFHIRYTLTNDPIIFDSLVKQILRSPELGPPAILATIDETPYTIIEDLVRSQLQLADDGGIDDLPIAEIYSGMDNLGYVTEGKLTFYKNKFSPQWRFLVHTILHCLSTKSGSWDQFGSSLAVALICLSDGRKFNWSSYIFKGMVSNIGNAKKFLMYPRFLQTILGIETSFTRQYHVFKLSSKLFANMKLNFEGQPMQLLAAMLPQDQEGEGAGFLTLMQNVNSLETELKDTKKLFKDVVGISYIPTDVPTGVAHAGISNKGKTPMVEEDITVKERTLKQMEDDRLGEEAAKRMVALIKRKKQALAEKLAKERMERPMTLVQQRTYMRQFVKNQSSALYSTGWTKAKVESFTDAQLKEEFERFKSLANTKVQAFNVTTIPSCCYADDKTFIKVVSDEDSTDEALILWSSLAGWEVLIDSQEGGKGSFVWNHQSLWQIRSWRLYTLSNVHVLETVSGEVLYMFADVSYPLSVKLMERMLKHKLEIDKDVVGNDMTTAEQLIRFIKNQIAAAQVSPV
ncbi:hypothetical protein Tco_0855872 [Tanacetum coccineum]